MSGFMKTVLKTAGTKIAGMFLGNRSDIYVEKLGDIYTSNYLKMTQHLDIYLLTFWTYILPFGYKYYNLDIHIAIWTYLL